ncbi:MAG TPA: hypothetical protein VGL08_10900 [Paraburkholderia sp.]|jgi:uncharacterized protein (UPF0333 family)
MQQRPQPPARRFKPRRRERGQASAEYLVVTFVVVVALLGAADIPAVSQLIAAFKSFFSAYSFALSLP